MEPAFLERVSAPPGAWPHAVQLADGGVTVIGRGADCDACLCPEARVLSRRHLSVSQRLDAQGRPVWHARDEGSTNGSFVNGQRIGKGASLQIFPLDVLSFGAADAEGGQLQYRLCCGAMPEPNGAADAMDLSATPAMPSQASSSQDAAAGAAAAAAPALLVDTGLSALSLASEQQQQQQQHPRACALKRDRPRSWLGCNANSSPPASPLDAAAPAAAPAAESAEEAAFAEPAAPTERTRKPRRCGSQDDCPFSSLMSIVKRSAKKFCSGGACSTRQRQALAAADAACQAISQQQRALLLAARVAAGSSGADLALAASSSSSSSSAVTASPGAGAVDDDSAPPSTPYMPLADDTDAASTPSRSTDMPPPPLLDAAPATPLAAVPAPAPAPAEDAAAAASATALRTELTCPICQDPFLHACSLACAHSFCEPCVRRWLGKSLSCPVCRQPVLVPPARARPVDGLVDLTLRAAPPPQTALLALHARQQEYAAAQQADARARADLERLLERALQRGRKFVNVARPWSANEQAGFLHGARQYAGAPREAFCGCTGLSEDFVQRASLRDLYVAAENVGLARDADAWNRMEPADVRNRLCMFIRFG